MNDKIEWLIIDKETKELVKGYADFDHAYFDFMYYRFFTTKNKFTCKYELICADYITKLLREDEKND